MPDSYGRPSAVCAGGELPRRVRALLGHAEATDLTNDVNLRLAVGFGRRHRLGCREGAAFSGLCRRRQPQFAEVFRPSRARFALHLTAIRYESSRRVALWRCRWSSACACCCSDNNAGIDDSLLGPASSAYPRATTPTGWRIKWTSYGWNVLPRTGATATTTRRSSRRSRLWTIGTSTDRRPMELIDAQTTMRLLAQRQSTANPRLRRPVSGLSKKAHPTR